MICYSLIKTKLLSAGLMVTILYSVYFMYTVKSRMIVDIPKCNKCAKSNITYTLNIENACPPDVKMLIIVLSHVHNEAARSMIRETWGNKRDQDKFHVKVVFFIGKTKYSISDIKKHEVYNDMIQLDMEEDYRKLSLKTILAFRWLKDYCKSVKYVLKTDDDVFINLQNLLHICDKYSLHNVIAGHCFGYEVPDRQNTSKWYVSHEEFPEVRYPPYCSGGGYLMYRSTALKLYEVSMDTPYFPMEDVYVGFLAHKLGLGTYHAPGFHIFSKPRTIDDYCRCLVLRHRVKVHEGYKIWRNITCWKDWDKNINYPCIEVFGDVLITISTFTLSILLLFYVILCIKIK